MRVLGEDLVELERPDAERALERELRAEDVAAEAAEMADVVGLVEARALLEQLGDAVDREQRGEHQRHRGDAGDRDQHDAQALVGRAAW